MSSQTISTSEAARRLRDHPSNVVRQLSAMVGSLDDCWPDLDHGLVETLERLRGANAKPQPRRKSEEEQPEVGQERKPGRSHASLKVLDKLARKDKWGGNAVGWDTLRNHYCRGENDLDEAVEELVDCGLLLAGQTQGGPYSLNPARKGEIEGLIDELRSQRR